MEGVQTRDIAVKGKHLFLIVTDLQHTGTPNAIEPIAKNIFTEVIPFLKHTNHVIYVRDIKKICIDEMYVSGSARSDWEVLIAVPQWPSQEEQITAAIAHECHHLARWQTTGYGKTLGEVIVSEGMATLYETMKSGWIPPWVQQDVSGEITKQVKKEWDSTTYNHKEWFFRGSFGRWIGYSVGYTMAKQYFHGVFDLATSLHVTQQELKDKVFT